MKLQTLKSHIPRLSGGPLAPRMLESQRLRGRAAVKRRLTFLERHPLCVECDKQGRTSAATVPDHKQPIWAGGADDLETNGNALCAAHHDAKSKCEARMRATAGWMSTPCQCGQHDG